MKRALLSFFCLSLTFVASAQNAPERITLFHADIKVLDDSTLDVTETIRVHGMGQNIKHGIFRDIPTLYPRRGWSRGDVPIEIWPWYAPFSFLGATRDGHEEPWFSKSLGNGTRVYLGAKDVFLPINSDFQYTLHYRIQRLLSTQLADHDELYWNVTGNDWDFEIDEASATVILAEDPQVPLRLQAYTGRQGERGTDYVAQDLGGGQAKFKATRMLGRNEGLTLVLGWPKGLVTGPRAHLRFWWALNDLREPLLAMLALITAVVLLLQRWRAHGQDPSMRSAVPRWEPPRNLSPAALRYLDGRGNDSLGFTATLLDLAVHGALQITKNKKGFLLTPLDDVTVEEELGAVFLKTLKKHGPADSGNIREATFFLKVVNAHNDLLAKRQKIDIALNLKQLRPSLICLTLGLALSTWLGVGMPLPKFLFGGLILSLAALASGLLVGAWDALRLGRIGVLWGQLIGFTGLGLVLLGLASFTTYALFDVFHGTWTALLVLPGGLMLGAFGVWMVQPSKDLQRLRDEIEGFTLYLGTAERQRLEYLHPPQDTPQLFEKLLPYAVALGVANTWSKRFASVLEAAAARGDYAPAWVMGYEHGFWSGHSGMSDFGSQFASDLGASISSASSPPSEGGSGFSGGGGDGGGSSGGGGGGGGGGGW